MEVDVEKVNDGMIKMKEEFTLSEALFGTCILLLASNRDSGQ
jgi:hypothetical protein